MEEKNIVETRKLDKKKVCIIAAGVVGILAVVYLGLSIYFMNHFYFRTRIGAVKVSGQSAVSAEKTMQDAMKDYELVITERDGNKASILGSEIDLKIKWNKKPANYIKKQNGFAWIVKLFVPDTHKIDGEFFYDEVKLTDKIVTLPAMDESKQVAAMDAKVSEYSETEGFTVVPSVPGTIVDKDAFTENIKACITILDESLNMAEGNSYVQPVIADDNEALLTVIAQMNKALDTVITYQVGSSTQILDKYTFHDWLYAKEDMTVGVQEDALTEYVDGLASNYNTCNKVKNFMTSYGQTISITNSHYGWQVDNTAEKAAIVADILAGEPVTRDLNYSMKAHSREENDYGNSYVEINLTAQHLFVYVDGQVVVESDFVSGNLKNNWDTPTGIWGLTYKTTDAVLRGADYATPVKYWMPYAGNVGMHDATWRDDFGGNIYKRDGSHGCVNLPLGKAKQIYKYVSKGFPVVVYKLEGTESEKGIAQDQAYEMDNAIKKIGKVSLNSEEKIVACRAQYDGLSNLAKEYVKKYQTLVDAEATLNALKNNAKEDVDNKEENKVEEDNKVEENSPVEDSTENEE
ncbi:MAG: L,D-transpeptidase/peptidoglycan binding protein [Agathobacter sp.]|nr:L,D-transpeptidase/peptidoglycan binding protein [Agathobacter sp.]